jgi:hypothetical protein
MRMGRERAEKSGWQTLSSRILAPLKPKDGPGGPPPMISGIHRVLTSTMELNRRQDRWAEFYLPGNT